VNSRIYTGRIIHTRHLPKRHHFTLPACFYAIDLSEYEQLNNQVRGFSVNRRNIVSLHENDYLTGTTNLRRQLLEQLATHPCAGHIDRIILVTVLRHISKVFNPVSFYYCLHENGAPVAVVAEVNNTFGDRHLYILDNDQQEYSSYPLDYDHPKAFHVSPFNNMQGRYHFTFTPPAEEIRITISLHREEGKIMEACLTGTGIPFTSKNLAKTLIHYPLNAQLIPWRILHQAAHLRYRHRLPLFHRPDPISSMTIRSRKTASAKEA
jgi:cyclopropane-fatty-acyl-phospholipid synthase